MRRRRFPTDPISRRLVLKALGLGGTSVFLPSLLRGRARADQLGAGQRILFYVTGHGTVYENWSMRPGGQPENQDWDFDLSAVAQNEMSEILSPLWGLRDKLLVLDGLSNATGRSAFFNEHEMGHASILSGRVPVEGGGSLGHPDGWSVDQMIANTIDDPGPIKSLEYAVGGWPVNFDASGQSIPYEENVFDAYDRLFPSGPADPGDPTDEMRIRQSQPSMLDFVADQYQSMTGQLSGADQQKIEQHRDLIRDLELQLEELADLNCNGPEPPSGTPTYGDPLYPAQMADIFIGLLQVSLSCGISRVATLRAETMFNETIGAPAGDLHNDYAHAVDDDPNAADIMTAYHVHQAEGFRRLIEALDAVPDVGGGTLLDNTVCVWCNELSTGSHRMVDIPLVIAGGTNYFDSGRYVRWAPTGQINVFGSDIDIGPAHNKFLVALARSMGVDIDEFGHTQVPDSGGGMFSTGGLLDRVALP